MKKRLLEVFNDLDTIEAFTEYSPDALLRMSPEDWMHEVRIKSMEINRVKNELYEVIKDLEEN